MEKLIIRVLNIVDHLSSEMVLCIVSKLITCMVSMGWGIMLEILGQVVVIILVSMHVLVVVLSSVMEVWSSVHIWVVDIGNPVVWVVLDSMHVVVVRDVGWVVLSLIQVAIVSTVVAIDTSVNIVVVTVVLSGEVTLVSQMWLVSLQVPESSIKVSETVTILSMNWGSMVWVDVGMMLEWSRIVVWNIPGSVEAQISIRVVGSNWMVNWGSVEEWIISVMVSMLAVSIMRWDCIVVLSVHLTIVGVLSVLFLGILGSSLLSLLVLLLHKHSGVSGLMSNWLIDMWGKWVLVWRVRILSISKWTVASVAPWVIVAHSSVLWVSSVVVWESTVGHVSIWSLSISEVVELLSSVGDGMWVSEFVVGITMVKSYILMLVTLLDLTMGLVLVSWLSLCWDNVSWVPDITMSVSMSVWFHLQNKVSIEDI